MAEDASLSILLVDDERVIHQNLTDYLSSAGHRVDNAYDGRAALNAIEAREYNLVLLDVKIPQMDGLTALKKMQEIQPLLSIVLISAYGSMEMVIDALRSGATDFLTKPINLVELDAVLEKSKKMSRLLQQKRHLQETIRGIQSYYNIQRGMDTPIGVSSKMRQVNAQIQHIVEAGCDTILITGETGTGKEIVARQIHASGSSTVSPFIAVSCPAIPESLFESELFGHTKGSFTGAVQDKIGYFELADRGTLFLDEIADIPLQVQASLLRVLDTRSLRRVGSLKEIHVKVRVISATNAPLDRLIEQGEFRRDLFYRINVFSIHLAPLRERREDILPLAQHFLSVYSRDRKTECPEFSTRAKQMLLRYDYPGNVRELRNIVECAAVLCRSGAIQPKHLSISKQSSADVFSASSLDKCCEARDSILAALGKARWNRKQAARILGIPYSTFRYRMKIYKID